MLSRLFGKKPQKEQGSSPFNDDLGIPSNHVSFDKAIERINKLSGKAKATFLFRLVESLPNDQLQTLKKYVDNKTKKV